MTGAVISLIVDGKILRPHSRVSRAGGWKSYFLLRRDGRWEEAKFSGGWQKLALFRLFFLAHFSFTFRRDFLGEFSLHCVLFKLFCSGGVGSFPEVFAPAAAHTRNNNNRRRPVENVGKSENISAALNQMQIELVGAGALLEIFNFPRARSLARSFPPIFPLCLPEKQTGIDFLSPRVFRRALLGGARSRAFPRLCVCMLLIIFPRQRCFFR